MVEFGQTCSRCCLLTLLTPFPSPITGISAISAFTFIRNSTAKTDCTRSPENTFSHHCYRTHLERFNNNIHLANFFLFFLRVAGGRTTSQSATRSVRACCIPFHLSHPMPLIPADRPAEIRKPQAKPNRPQNHRGIHRAETTTPPPPPPTYPHCFCS